MRSSSSGDRQSPDGSGRGAALFELMDRNERMGAIPIGTAVEALELSIRLGYVLPRIVVFASLIYSLRLSRVGPLDGRKSF